MIRMRTVHDSDKICDVCGSNKNNSLELFEIKFSEHNRIVICDRCNSELLNKVLKASCNVNNKLKSKKDMKIISRRNNRDFKTLGISETNITETETEGSL